MDITHRMGSVVQNPSILGEPVDIEAVQSGVCTGRILQDTDKACICSEDCVQIIDASEGHVIQEWKCSYGEIYYMTEVVCDTHRFIVLAARVSSKAASSVIVVLNVSSLTIVKLIFFPDEVTYLAALTSDSEFGISNFLRCSDGIFAVGSYGGKVYLLDLNISQSLSQGPVRHPLPIKVIDDEEILEPSFCSEHLALLLFQDFVQGGSFVYQKHRFPVKEVEVSAISYVQQLSSIFVGLSIGCFMVFNLRDFTTAYTSPYSPQRLSPIVDFVYVEPENDPKCFVYVWVARGNRRNLGSTSCEFETKLTLYQLIYSKKSVSSGITSYAGFQGCVPRMEYALTNTPVQPDPQSSLSSQLLRCFSTKCFRNMCDLNSSNHEEDNSMAVFVWSAAGLNSQPHYFVAVFDINQWYQAQMPNAVRWKKPGVLGCSYLAFFSLDQLADQSQHVLDICVRDLSSFPSHPPIPLTHTWPSAMKFHASVLKRSNISSCTFLGVPRFVLHEINTSRRLLFSQPDTLFGLLVKADFIEEDPPSQTSTMQQQKSFLNILLDHDIPSETVAAVVENWITSTEFSNCAVTELVFDEIKKLNFEQGSITHSPPFLMLKRLETLRRFLDKIFICFGEHSLEVSSDFMQKYELIAVQKKVIDIAVFCISKGLFGLVPLSAHYLDFVKSRLAVQHLCDEFSPSRVAYPPTSMDNFLNVLRSFNLTAIHSYMLFFLNDVQHLMPKFSGISVCYAESMCLPCSLVQIIEVFWMIDHGMYKDIEKHDFFSVSVHSERVFEWQHEFVAYSLLSNGLESLSLKYVSLHGRDMLSVEEVKKKISIYVANSRICEGYIVLKDFKDSQHYSELFEEFIRLCDQAGKFDFLLNMKFCALEEELIMQYIKGSKPCDLHMMLLYLLMNNRLSDARNIREELFKSLDSSSLKEIVDIYIDLLKNSCENKWIEEESSACKNLVEVNQSFSVTVGKSMSSREVISHMGTIYNALNTRSTSNYRPITESNTSTPLFSDTFHLSSSFQGIHTPQRKPLATPQRKSITKSEAGMNTQSPFASFLTDIRDFKNRMTSSGAGGVGAVTHKDLPAVSTPIFDEVDRQLDSKFGLNTPTSILKRLSGPKQQHNKSIRFVMESPDEVQADANRALSVEEQSSEEIEVFGSPLESPSKFTSYTSGEILPPKLDAERKTGVDSQISMNLERQDTPLKQAVTSTPVQFPHIQLTSHANLYTPVQSDSTNRVISSSSNFPSVAATTYPASEPSSPYLRGVNQYQFVESVTGPPASFVFSPPLTRSSARRPEKIPTSIDDIKSAPIALLTPPPQLPSGGDTVKKSTRQRKPKTQTSGIGLRRSARLLKGKK